LVRRDVSFLHYFTFVLASSRLALQRAARYHVPEMSDFYFRQRRQRQRALVKAMGLDFFMWKAKQDRPALLPYPFFPLWAKGYLEDAFKQSYSELVDGVYWQRKPAPRCRASRIQKLATTELFEDAPPKQQNTQIHEIAVRLGLTTRHVRRMLTRLSRAGKIPQFWLDGRQWCVPVDGAVKAITLEIKKRHAPHTNAAMDTVTKYVTNCRKEADSLACELAEVEARCETCERWHRLTRTVQPKNVSISVKTRHREKELRRAYNFMAALAEKWRWSFCRLFEAIYEALQNGSKTPVKDTNAALGLNHAAFYRNHTKREIKEALLLAQQCQANTYRVGGQVPTPSEDEGVQEAFSEWRNKVPEAALWVDTG
jgi:DNA-binding Lrp family transcriptional regulator